MSISTAEFLSRYTEKTFRPGEDKFFEGVLDAFQLHVKLIEEAPGKFLSLLYWQFVYLSNRNLQNISLPWTSNVSLEAPSPVRHPPRTPTTPGPTNAPSSPTHPSPTAFSPGAPSSSKTTSPSPPSPASWAPRTSPTGSPRLTPPSPLESSKPEGRSSERRYVRTFR